MRGPNDGSFDSRGEIVAGLKLAGRGFLIVAAGSAIWHFPAGPGAVKLALAAIAALIFLLAASVLAVCALVWRNLAWNAKLGRRMDWRGGRAANALLSLPFLAALVAPAYILFDLVGRAYP